MGDGVRQNRLHLQNGCHARRAREIALLQRRAARMESLDLPLDMLQLLDPPASLGRSCQVPMCNAEACQRCRKPTSVAELIAYAGCCEDCWALVQQALAPCKAERRGEPVAKPGALVGDLLR